MFSKPYLPSISVLHPRILGLPQKGAIKYNEQQASRDPLQKSKKIIKNKFIPIYYVELEEYYARKRCAFHVRDIQGADTVTRPND